MSGRVGSVVRLVLGLCLCLVLVPWPGRSLDLKYRDNAPLSDIWEQITELLVAEGGSVHPALRLVETKFFGLGVNTSEDLQPWETLIRIPTSLYISGPRIKERFEKEKDAIKDRQTRMNWLRLLSNSSDDIILSMLYGRLRAGLDPALALVSPFQALLLKYWPTDCISGLNAPEVAISVLPKQVRDQIRIMHDHVNAELVKG